MPPVADENHAGLIDLGAGSSQRLNECKRCYQQSASNGLRPNELHTDSTRRAHHSLLHQSRLFARMFDQSEWIRVDQEVSCIKKPPGLPVRFKLSLRFFASEVRDSRYLTGSWVA